MTYLLALDQGTSSSRSIVFDEVGRIVAKAQCEFTQIFPQPGWVEHDAMEIWAAQLATAREALASASRAVASCAAQISIASCSTQPGCGKICVNSHCALATMRPTSSNTMLRELEVPWSRASR